MARSVNPAREHVTVPRIHAALIDSYEAESEVIDQRPVIEVADPAKRRKLNRNAPHPRQMRRTAERLASGEVLAVESRRIRRLPGADTIDWLDGDPRVGAVVTPDDVVRQAAPHERIHI